MLVCLVEISSLVKWRYLSTISIRMGIVQPFVFLPPMGEMQVVCASVQEPGLGGLGSKHQGLLQQSSAAVPQGFMVPPLVHGVVTSLGKSLPLV